MLEPTHGGPLAPSSSSPLQPSSIQRLPSITHHTAALQQQNQYQPLSSHKILHHSQSMPEPQTSLPPRRHVHPQRMDSTSSTSVPAQEPVQLTPQLVPPSSIQHAPGKDTAYEDSSTSPPHTNPQTRHRGKQTKAACIPCRRRKSKVSSLYLSFLPTPAVRCLTSSILLLLPRCKAMSTLQKGTIIFILDMQSEKAETISVLAEYCPNFEDFFAFNKHTCSIPQHTSTSKNHISPYMFSLLAVSTLA